MAEIMEYFAILATGIVGLYAFRKGMLIRQHRKDAKALAKALNPNKLDF